MELSTVPGEEDARKLARQVRVSFGLPWWLEKPDAEGGTLQAPPALPCLCWQRFMLQANSIFASWDIREVPREKFVAYARTLQYWAEQNDLPTGGKPHLLAESVLELRKEVRWYLTFTNEEVFWGVTVPEVEDESLAASSSANIPESPPSQNCNPRKEPQNLQDGIRCYTHPSPW